MRALKIIYYVPQLTVGGTERHLSDLVRHLDKNQFNPTVWCPGMWGPIGDEIARGGVAVVRFPFPDYPYQIDRFWRAFYYLRKERFDIFHSYGYALHYMDAILARLSGIPSYISSKRNIRHWEEGGRLHVRDWIRNQLSHIILANCEAAKRKSILVEHIPPSQIRVIHNGVDANRLKATKTKPQLEQELAIPRNAIIIGNLANLKPVKGQSRLLRAFSKLILETSYPAYLVIVGSGSEQTALLRLAADLAIEKRFRLITTADNAYDYLNFFDIFALPSISEGFPNAILEAMALGKPIIASRTGGIDEAVVDGETGLLCDSDEEMSCKLKILLEDSNLRNRLGVNSLHRVEMLFQLQKKIGEYEALYVQLCRKGAQCG